MASGALALRRLAPGSGPWTAFGGLDVPTVRTPAGSEAAAGSHPWDAGLGVKTSVMAAWAVGLSDLEVLTQPGEASLPQRASGLISSPQLVSGPLPRGCSRCSAPRDGRRAFPDALPQRSRTSRPWPLTAPPERGSGQHLRTQVTTSGSLRPEHQVGSTVGPPSGPSRLCDRSRA